MDYTKVNYMNVLDAEASLYAQDTQADSFYFFGRLFAENGDEYDYLLHNTKVDGGEGSPQFVWQQLSFTNIKTGERIADHKVYPIDALTIGKDKFEVLLPESIMSGNKDKMKVTISTSVGGFDLDMVPEGPIFYYNSGVFPWLDNALNWEYAFPKIKTTGTFTLKGETFKVSGTTFFDRQWLDFTPIVLTNDYKWSWFAINLDDPAYTIAVWDVNWKNADGSDTWQGFATVMSPEGVISTAPIKPLVDKATDFWKSPDSGRTYANEWVIEIQGMDTELLVKTTNHGNEMLNSMALARPDGGKTPLHGLEHNMQTPASVVGKFMGKEVTGICHMECVGGW